MLKKLINFLVCRTDIYKNLEAAHTRLSKDFEDVIQNRATLRDIAIRNGTITVDAVTEAAGLLALQFINWRDTEGAINYLETIFAESLCSAAAHDRPQQEVIVTVQRKEGKTPHQIREELEQELQELKDRLSKYEGKV